MADAGDRYGFDAFDADIHVRFIQSSRVFSTETREPNPTPIAVPAAAPRRSDKGP